MLELKIEIRKLELTVKELDSWRMRGLRVKEDELADEVGEGTIA